MEQNKTNIVIGIIAVAVLLLSLVAVFKEQKVVVNLPASSLGATSRVAGTVSDYTSLFNNFTGQIEVDGASLLTGTTTVTQSVDGIVVGGTVTSVSTTSVKYVYTNTTGPKACSSGSPSYVRQLKSGTFAPSVNLAVGTSTASGAVTLSLLATTTTATSSSQFLTLTERRFLLDNNDQLVVQIADSQANTSSSTYYSNLNYELGIYCQDASI